MFAKKGYGALPGGGGLTHARRRLSVVSNNKLIEGLSALGIKETDNTRTGSSAATCYASFFCSSKRGYAPYNPRKRNQDSYILEEHRETKSLLMGVFDGHGEAGDLVSRFFTERLPGALYRNQSWATDPLYAMVEELDRLEQLLLSGALGPRPWPLWI
jgi:hypothetical protein